MIPVVRCEAYRAGVRCPSEASAAVLIGLNQRVLCGSCYFAAAKTQRVKVSLGQDLRTWSGYGTYRLDLPALTPTPTPTGVLMPTHAPTICAWPGCENVRVKRLFCHRCESRAHVLTGSSVVSESQLAVLPSLWAERVEAEQGKRRAPKTAGLAPAVASPCAVPPGKWAEAGAASEEQEARRCAEIDSLRADLAAARKQIEELAYGATSWHKACAEGYARGLAEGIATHAPARDLAPSAHPALAPLLSAATRLASECDDLALVDVLTGLTALLTRD